MRDRILEMETDNIEVVTLSIPYIDKRGHPNRRGHPDSYFRVSLYEFVGDPPKARYKEDLNVGVWSFALADKEAKRIAKERNLSYIKDISMGDSIDKVWNFIFREKSNDDVPF